jgi:hypothetical protein
MSGGWNTIESDAVRRPPASSSASGARTIPGGATKFYTRDYGMLTRLGDAAFPDGPKPLLN